MTVKKKLGKKAPRHDPRTLKLSSYFFGPKLPEIPSRKYWYDGVKYGMYKNDIYGDCTCASACNFVRSWSKNTNVEIDLPDEAALEAYKAITGFDPEDPSTDNGAVELDVLKYWQKTGIGGHQIKAFVSVNVKHREELKAAIALFGGVYVGLGMPLGWESIEPGTKIWDVVDGPDGQIGSWGGHCLTGDTKIPLLDGREFTIKDLTEKYSNETFWVYSCDKEGNIVPGKASLPRLTSKNQQIVKIKLDDGGEIKCTSDHLILMRDGNYKKAGELKENDSLMPLYRKLSFNEEREMNGYEKIYNPKDQKWYFTHRIVTSNLIGKQKGVIHHIDFNKNNNSPDNLTIMTWEDHTKLHAEFARPENLIAYSKSQNGRNKSRELMNKLWEDLEWKTIQLAKASEKGKLGMQKRLAEHDAGKPWPNTEKQKEARIEGGKRLSVRKQTEDEKLKRINTIKNKYENDKEFKNKMNKVALKNLEKTKNLPLTEAQKNARKENALKLCYKRFFSDKFATYEEWIDFKNKNVAQNNHKVISIEINGYEDVYDLTVDEHHNFALSSGIFVHNCVPIVGFDEQGVTCVTWGVLQKITWDAFDKYCDEAWCILSEDFLKDGKAPSGFDKDQLLADLSLVSR